jgi:hypothetical protein
MTTGMTFRITKSGLRATDSSVRQAHNTRPTSAHSTYRSTPMDAIPTPDFAVPYAAPKSAQQRQHNEQPNSFQNGQWQPHTKQAKHGKVPTCEHKRSGNTNKSKEWSAFRAQRVRRHGELRARAHVKKATGGANGSDGTESTACTGTTSTERRNSKIK